MAEESHSPSNSLPLSNDNNELNVEQRNDITRHVEDRQVEATPFLDNERRSSMNDEYEIGRGGLFQVSPRERETSRLLIFIFVIIPAALGFLVFLNYSTGKVMNVDVNNGKHMPKYMLNDTVAPTILISIDGFRYDYIDRKDEKTNKYLAPTIRDLASKGVRARPGMKPVMPSKTFPNHWSLVTGLYPESHGIIGNTMYSEEIKQWFHYQGKDPHWWQGEPIWQTLQRTPRKFKEDELNKLNLNYTTGCVFWVGSDIEKHLCDAYWTYDKSITYEKRIQRVLDLLLGNVDDLPPGESAQFITLYFEKVDSAGHGWGPNSKQVNDQIIKVDNSINKLLQLLKQHIPIDINIIIVSDHGMAEVSTSREIYLDNFIPKHSVQDVEQTPMGTWINVSITSDDLFNDINTSFHSTDNVFDNVPRAKVYKQADIPDKWHLKHSRFITPVVTLADVGYTVKFTHEKLLRRSFIGERIYGNHGFDNEAKEMQAMFIANGPAFRQQSTVEGFENIDLYELICRIYGAKPAPNNGTLDISQSFVLRPS